MPFGFVCQSQVNLNKCLWGVMPGSVCLHRLSVHTVKERANIVSGNRVRRLSPLFSLSFFLSSLTPQDTGNLFGEEGLEIFSGNTRHNHCLLRGEVFLLCQLVSRSIDRPSKISSGLEVMAAQCMFQARGSTQWWIMEKFAQQIWRRH